MAALARPLSLSLTVNPRTSTEIDKLKSTCKIDQTNPSISLSFSHGSVTILPASPNSSNYATVLESCNCPALARQIHAHALKGDFAKCRKFLETRLLYVYVRCNLFNHACHLFDKMPHRNIYSWVGIITASVEHGFNKKAFLMFQEFLYIEEVTSNLEFFLFPVVLKACSCVGFIEPGRELHGFLLKTGFTSNIYVGNALIDMYGKCGALDEALKAFDEMEERDCVSWNSVITGCAANGMPFESLKFLENMQLCNDTKPNLVTWSATIASFAQNGYDEEAVGLLGRMLESGYKPNAQTLSCVLPSLGRLEAIEIGKEIHGYVFRHRLESNPFIINGLIDVYSRCGDLGTALELFFNSSVRNLVSYTTIIAGCCQNDSLILAKELFYQMELDGVEADTVCCNLIISLYCANSNFEEALKIFREIQMGESIEVDFHTLGSVLKACAAVSAIREGKMIHSYAISRSLNSNLFVCNSLIEMYCKFSDFFSAEIVLHSMVERDTVTWNLLIAGYARANHLNYLQELICLMRDDGFEPNVFTWNGVIAGYMENGHNELVLETLNVFRTAGLKPDIYTIGMIIPVCSRLVSSKLGKQAHSYAIRCGFDNDVHIGASLVDMYAKCGAIGNAALAFNRISWHNLVSFNSLLAGYRMHGFRTEGLALFDAMLEIGIRPDAISFLTVLSLCAHVGSVEEGIHYFSLMETYGITPNLKHYTCMVDLFSRNGKLNEAFLLIKNIPMEPDAVIWGTLLSGCVVHHNVELGEIAANRLILLDEDNASNYILLSNLYAVGERNEDLFRTRQFIRESGMQKWPGWSWLEENGQIHVFLANDSSHTLADEIYVILENLALHLRMQGEVLGTI